MRTTDLFFVGAVALAGLALWGKIPMGYGMTAAVGLVVMGGVLTPNATVSAQQGGNV